MYDHIKHDATLQTIFIAFKLVQDESRHKADIAPKINESLTFDRPTGIFTLAYVASNFTLNTAMFL